MAPKETQPRIVELAATISNSVAQLQQILDAQGVPSPSFDEDAQYLIPKDASDAQDAVIDAAAELYDLLLEPLTMLFKHASVTIASQCGYLPSLAADYDHSITTMLVSRL
jgi:hypothetical protein